MSADLARIRSRLGSTTCTTVPAQMRYLEVSRLAVRIAMDGYGADAACETDIGLAVDELASVLITHAGSAGDLRVAVTQDRTNVHIELGVSDPTAGSLPVLDALSLRLLDATTDAHVFQQEDGKLVGRLRRRLGDRPERLLPSRDATDGTNAHEDPSQRR